MGLARLLGKGWVVFCVFAAGHAVAGVAQRSPFISGPQTSCVAALLFGAMGLLFIGGYAISSGHLLSRFHPTSFIPGFNEIVISVFLLLILWFQISPFGPSKRWEALASAVRFAVPEQRALEDAVARCGANANWTSSTAIAWLLAFIFLGSAVSRLRMTAALVRIERGRRTEPVGAAGVALIIGVAAAIGVQLLFLGGLYPMLSCSAVTGLLGGVVAGAGPLMLSYLVAASLVNLVALRPET